MAASPGSAGSHEGGRRLAGNTGIYVVFGFMYFFPFEAFIPVAPLSPDQSVRSASVGPSVRLFCAPFFCFSTITYFLIFFSVWNFLKGRCSLFEHANIQSIFQNKFEIPKLFKKKKKR